MPTILDTVVEYEDKLVELVASAQAPVTDYVAMGVELLGDRVPAATYPEALPTPLEVLDTQVAFAKKLIDANAAIAKAVLETVAPLAGYQKPVKTVKTATKAA